MGRTKILIHNTEQIANAEKLALFQKTKHLFKGATTEYTHVIKHPTKNEWATVYNIGGKYWQIVRDHLNPNQINNLIDFPADWKKQTEI